MSAKSNYPPKITCPGMAKILKRDRLFKNLDEARQQSKLIWIAAPAGSGKTTLLSSYIQEHQLLHCWYQVDEGDRDLATFFHYLGLAGKKAAPRRKKTMPALTAEYLQNIAAFTRSFFEDMSSRLKGDGVIVLDNFQLFPDDHPIHALLPNIVDSLGAETSLVVISRQLPPKALTPLLLRGQLTTLDTRQIRFDSDEWNSVCKLLKPESYDDSLFLLHDKLDGWVAGLLLSINAPKVFDNIPPQMAQTNVLEEYIADEFLSSLDGQTSELLMSVCYMPHITQASVNSLANIDRPQEILAGLARKNLFILQQGEKKYTLHPLVREYLQRKVEIRLSKRAHHDLLLASASAMLEQNEYEPAADLFLERQEWTQLVAIILSHAEELYNTGRVVSLLRYISALPNSHSKNEPWIDYWRGNLLAYRDIGPALEYYDSAYATFLANGNAKGAYLSWYSAVSTICRTLQCSTQLSDWLNRYDELCNRWLEPPKELQNGAVENVLAQSYFLTDIDVKKREFWKNKLLLAIEETNDPHMRLQMMSNHLIIAAISGIKVSDIAIFKKLEKNIAGGKEIPTISHIYAIVACNIFVMSFHSYEEFLDLAYQALDIADNNGVSVFNGLIYMRVVYAAVLLKRFSLAKEYLNISKKNMPEKDPVYGASYLMALSYAGTYMDEFKDINVVTKQYISVLNDVPLSAFSIHTKCSYLYYLCERCYEDEALALHDGLLEQVENQDLPAQISLFYMIYAKIFFNNRLIDQSDQYLEKSIKILSDDDIISYCYWPPDLMSWACQRALMLNIETTYVENFITRHYSALSAPNSQNETWPWAFRLYTFGRFEFVRNKEIDDKNQRATKSFQLLKTLAVAEKNMLSATRIRETLYGEHEHNKASQLLDNHLHRLRKNLESDEAIVREGDDISLSPKYFWVDKNAFEVLVKQKITQENASNIATQIQAIYRGEYMPEDDSIDCIAHRERYRNLFMSVLFKCLDFMASNTESAVDICLQALVREPFSEPLYRKLISLYLHSGNREMAEMTLLQCRGILQRHLNKDLSEETLSLLNND